jgi:hypothetical protein
LDSHIYIYNIYVSNLKKFQKGELFSKFSTYLLSSAIKVCKIRQPAVKSIIRG